MMTIVNGMRGAITSISKKKKALFIFLLSSKSSIKDTARREFILNVLLLGSILLSFIATLAAIVSEFQNTSPKGASLEVGIIFLLFSAGYAASRVGKSRPVAYLLIAEYIILTTLTSLQSGGDVPEDLLIYAFIIIMSGILISSRFAFVVTFIISLLLFTIISLQNNHGIVVDSSWRKQPPVFEDAVVYGVTFFIIALVSWLFNRETEKTLKRARSSEYALQKQKEHLEVLVEERTQELQQAQTEKLTQMYRFAEFGRTASGLFHDLVNPLTIVSLNLDRLNEKSEKIEHRELKSLINRSVRSTKQLENFVLAARRQIQNQDSLQLFSLKHEIMQVISILNYKAKSAHIQIRFTGSSNIKTFNNPIKFSQLMMNLIINAIDSYEEIAKKEKIIAITIANDDKKITITIQDWANGVKPENLSKIFEPLFTTKDYEKGTGIGLAICHNIVKKSFKGTIQVKSREHKGTIFTVKIPIQKPPSGRIKRERVI